MSYLTPVIFYAIDGIPLQILSGDQPHPGDSSLERFKNMIDLQPIPQTIRMGYGTYVTTGRAATHYPDGICGGRASCLLCGELGNRGSSVLAGSGYFSVRNGNRKDPSGDAQLCIVFPSSCTSSV